MNYLKFISYSAIALQSFALTAMQAPSLGQFKYDAASVLPYVRWSSKPQYDYFLLGREAGGTDAGTWDAFGGKKDKGETHPVVTASREFAEETAYTIMDPSNARKYIDVDAGHTNAVVASTKKNSVFYITKFNENDMKKLRDNFYAKRQKASGKGREKDAIAWVRWDRLSDAIANAKRDNTGKLITPINVEGDIIKSDGKLVRTKLPLRPYSVSALQPFFKGDAYIQGKDKAIRFYN